MTNSLKSWLLSRRLPPCPAIRAYIMHEGMEGNLDAAASVFHQFRQCGGYEEIKAELFTFFVARYTYRGQLKAALEFYALFVRPGTAGIVFQARETALHILTCMLMEVRLQEAVNLWRNYLQLPLADPCRKHASQTGSVLLLQARKNSNIRLVTRVFAALHMIAQETDEQQRARKAQSILETWQKNR